jgi:hypothetical protein
MANDGKLQQTMANYGKLQQTMANYGKLQQTMANLSKLVGLPWFPLVCHSLPKFA